WPRAPADSCHLRINRLDRAPCQLDTLLTTQQLQQDEHPLVRTQGSEQADLILQRALQNLHPHARREPMHFRQLDKPTTLAGPDLADDSIRNARRQQTIHNEANHTRRPPRIPPAEHPLRTQFAKFSLRGMNPVMQHSSSSSVCS